MKNRLRATMVLALLITVILMAGCGRKRETQKQQEAWTPAPVTGSMQLATPQAVILPTEAPTMQATRIATATATRQTAATRDQNIVVITEQDVLQAVEAGVAAQQGATLQGVGIDFVDGKMRLTADRASYSFVTVDNLEVIGKFVAVEGQLQMETESLSPRGIVTSFIPSIANQVLAQYTSRWYVEDVKTLDDRLELRVRQ